VSKVLVIFGTRPEAIKLCPVILQIQSLGGIEVRVCVTAQHREMLDQVLDVFGVHPDFDLNVMARGQTLLGSTSRMMGALEPVLAAELPDLVIVQGDTTTTLCGALAAFYNHIPIGHVEAGLRTCDIHEPFPEEMNRVLTGRLTSLHFAPTASAAENLYREGVASDSVFLTGNTGIDAVLYVRDALSDGRLNSTWNDLQPGKKLIVVTAHRRESFGSGFEQICSALSDLSRRDDVRIVYPVHPNPRVKDYVTRRLSGHDNIMLVDPLNYVAFVDLMRQAYLLITDSGGIQEEGPSLGKPILVLRSKTERPEAVEAGTVRLVGTDETLIVAEAVRLLDDHNAYESMARLHNPYGDGHASERIARAVAGFLNAPVIPSKHST
jgi:UDP-N-acetylglucosamine 2-epimerase (non-hydrolysing)